MTERTSPWLATVPDTLQYKPLAADIACDVIVIGGGLAGVMSAWYLHQAGKRVVLLEQNHLATGDTGYTTAFLTRVPDTSCSDLATRHGPDFLRQLFEATGAAQQEIIALIKAEQIDCDLREYSSYFSSYAKGDTTLAREWAVIQAADPNAEWLGAEQLASVQPQLAEAIHFKNEASFHVRKFIFGLVRSAKAKGLQVFEESPVTQLEVQAKRVIATTPHGRVVAPKVVIASGLPTHCPELQALFSPRLTFALAARYPSAPPLSDAQFWDTDGPYQYYRKIDDHTVMLGGCDRPANERADLSAHVALRQWLDEHIPGAAETTLEWSGSLFETSDGLPYITAHPQFAQQVWFACGFGGNGMVTSALAGKLLSQLVSGDLPATAELFSLKRTKATVAKSHLGDHRPLGPGAAAQRSGLFGRRWVRVIGKVLALAAWITVIILPAKIFFAGRGGLSVLDDLDGQTKSLIIFPLFGLYAFTLAKREYRIYPRADE